MTLMNILLFISILILLGLSVWLLYSRYQTLPCPAWLSWMVEMDNPFIKVHHASIIIYNLDIAPGMKVVDAGCGPGRLTIPLAHKLGPLGEVVALDIQEEMLTKVAKKAQIVNLHNIQFLKAGIGEGKLQHNQFDRALLVTVLGEIPNQASALKELFDALKSGGILSITEIILDPHFQSKSTVLRLAKTAGFREKNCFGGRFAFTMLLEKPQDL